MTYRRHPRAVPLTIYNWRRTADGTWVRFRPAHEALGGSLPHLQGQVVEFLETYKPKTRSEVRSIDITSDDFGIY